MKIQMREPDTSTPKGIILAGGKGSRLYPLTIHTSKQLLPIYNKPMIYYPLSILIDNGIKDILIIAMSRDMDAYKALLGDGSDLGIHITFASQDIPKGIAEAFIIGEDFIGDDPVALILGDNIFYGDIRFSLNFSSRLDKAVIFACKVEDPSRYGVLKFDKDNPNNKPTAIVEKPKKPPSPYAVTGLYLYDNSVISIAKSLKPSKRGELEITDLNQAYVNQDQLSVRFLEKGVAWLDSGTPESLMEASEFVKAVEKRQGIAVGCPEETAWKRGFISDRKLKSLGKKMVSTPYGQYLLKLLEK